MVSGVGRNAGLLLIVGVLATFCAPSDDAAWVNVNDRRVVLSTSASTVSDVLTSAGIAARPGMVRSILSGRLLQPNGNPPNVEMNGEPTTLASAPKKRATFVVADGVDTLEGVEGRDRSGPMPGGAPDVERTLYQPGQPRTERAWVGRISGEVVATLVTQPEVPAAPAGGKVVALTFDDGPHPVFTPAVLDILREEGVRATFCVIAQHGREHPELVKATVDAGHVLCNHTVNHRILPGKPYDYVFGQIAGGSEFLTSISGVSPPLFRAPSGQVSPDVVAVAHSQGMRILGWSVESNDYLRAPANVITQRVLSATQPGSIILLHDGGGDRSGTVAAVRPIIQALKAQGYSFVTPVPPPH